MSYPVPPPSYSDNSSGSKYGAAESHAAGSADEPLLSGPSSAHQAQSSAAFAGAWRGEHARDDVPDDFKVGVSVAECSTDIRNAFIRKVYGVLFCQLVGTALIGGIMSTETIQTWVFQHAWMILIPTFGSLVTLFALYFKAHSHPLNILLLALFTVLESLSVGAVVSMYDQTAVLQALVITIVIFIGLTLFTFSSTFDFSSLRTPLYVGLLALLGTGIVGIFIPFSRTVDLVYSYIGAMVFSGFILVDTHMIQKKMSPDDWVLACVSLYLDSVNLFLYVLRILGNNRD